MKVYRFYCEDIQSPLCQLEGIEAHHLNNVLRLQLGDQVELFDGNGALAKATIEQKQKRTVTLEIETVVTEPPRLEKRIIIAVAIAKSHRFDLLISKCTELNVDVILPVLYERTVKQASNPKVIDRWNNLAISSAKQCKRLFLPQIHTPVKLHKALDTIAETYDNCNLLYASLQTDSIVLKPDTIEKDTAAFVGPEGGFTDSEIELFKQRTATPVKLTRTVLRTETAAIAIASLLSVFRNS